MSLPLTRARRARIEPRASYVAMASLTSYFKTVTAPLASDRLSLPPSHQLEVQR